MKKLNSKEMAKLIGGFTTGCGCGSSPPKYDQTPIKKGSGNPSY